MALNIIEVLKFKRLQRKQTRTLEEEFQLAKCYEFGIGTIQNCTIAFEIYRVLRLLRPIDPKLLSVVYFKIGWFFKHGQACQQNLKLAYAFYKKAHDLKNPIASYNMALMSLRGQIKNERLSDETFVLTLLQENCLNLRHAQYVIADIYQENMKLNQTFIDKINSQTHSGSQRNHAEINYLSGVFHEHGIAGTKDLEKAKELYLTAQNQGYYKASIRLAEIAMHKNDFDEAEHHFSMALKFVSRKTEKIHICSLLSSCENFYENPTLLNHIQDSLNSYKQCQLATKIGYAAFNLLITINKDSTKSKEDTKIAIELYKNYIEVTQKVFDQTSALKKIIDLGDVCMAENDIENGIICYTFAVNTNGLDISNAVINKIKTLILSGKINQTQCNTLSKLEFDIMCMTAEKGHAESQYKVATMYESGNKIEKNLQKAILWYEKLLESKELSENSLATISEKIAELQYILAKDYEYNLDYSKRDFQKALELYQASANRGNKKSQYVLSAFYEYGWHQCPVNKIKAKYYLEKSAVQEYEPAMCASQNIKHSSQTYARKGVLKLTQNTESLNEEIKDLKDIIQEDQQKIAIFKAQLAKISEKMESIRNQELNPMFDSKDSFYQGQEKVLYLQNIKRIKTIPQAEMFYLGLQKELYTFFRAAQLNLLGQTIPQATQFRTKVTNIGCKIVSCVLPKIFSGLITAPCQANAYLEKFAEKRRLHKITELIDLNPENFCQSLALRITLEYKCYLNKIHPDKIESLINVVFNIINEGLNPDKLINVQKKDLEDHLFKYITTSLEVRTKFQSEQWIPQYHFNMEQV